MDVDYDSIDPDVKPYYNVTMIFGSLVFCERCKAEPQYTSSHPQFCDANYFDQALAMKRDGWTVTADLEAYCPACSRLQSSS